MYRLIIVDDEAIVRDGISQCIPWNETGFDLVGSFENGVEALEFIRKEPIDIIISDINMPKMNGTELSRILSVEFPSIVVILLTGYDDFEYAQEAVKNQVREFLLKPITVAEFKQVLKKIREELDALKTREEQQKIMQEKLKQSFPLLKERFLYRLVSGRLDSQTTLKRKDFFQWLDLEQYYQIVILELQDGWDELHRLTLAEQLKMIIQNADEVFYNRDEDLVLLLQGESRDLLVRKAQEIAQRAFFSSERKDNDSFYAGYGDVVDSPHLLKISYNGARNAIDYAKLMGLSQIISIDAVRDKEKVSPESFYALTKRLGTQLKEGGRSQSQAALNEIFSFMKKHYLTVEEATIYFTRLHVILTVFLQEMGLDVESKENGILHRPYTFTSITEAHDFFSEMIDAIEGQIEARRNDLVLSRVDKAREIIARRYQDKNFTLQDICDEMFLSTSQFSLLFKTGTGQTFVEYLTNWRVEEAKKLLKSTDCKSYEVAERVGYSDPRYFSQIFRKYTGITTMEYRRSVEE